MGNRCRVRKGTLDHLVKLPQFTNEETGSQPQGHRTRIQTHIFLFQIKASWNYNTIFLLEANKYSYNLNFLASILLTTC